MDGRSEFLVYLGASLTTIAALFTLQYWYASYLDVSVVHAQDTGAPADPKLEAVRGAERAKLASGAMPIEQAMHAIAERGRGVSAKLAAQQSDDLSAMSGWVHRPGFAAYQPRQAPVVAAPAAAAPVVAVPPVAAPRPPELPGRAGRAP